MFTVTARGPTHPTRMPGGVSGIGVTDVATYKVQRIDPTYFGEE